MEFVLAVKEIKTKYGINDAFYAMLSDYDAYNEEEDWMKSIMKQICNNGYPLQLSSLTISDSQWTIQVSDMIYRLSNLYGYQEDKCSYVLHKLALGLGVVTDSFNWDREFNTSQQGVNNPFASYTKSTSAYCPYCGHPYYKSYSAYCAFCGKSRK